MTKAEFKQSREYAELMNRVKAYTPGFKFTIQYHQIPRAKANALMVLLEDACKAGYLESVAIGAGFDSNGEWNPMMDVTYKRTAKAAR